MDTLLNALWFSPLSFVPPPLIAHHRSIACLIWDFWGSTVCFPDLVSMLHVEVPLTSFTPFIRFRTVVFELYLMNASQLLMFSHTKRLSVFYCFI